MRTVGSSSNVAPAPDPAGASIEKAEGEHAEARAEAARGHAEDAPLSDRSVAIVDAGPPVRTSTSRKR